MNTPAARPKAPWYFRLAKRLIRLGLPGGYRLMHTARRRGWLDVIVRYPIDRGVDIDIPLYRAENLWDREDVLNYDPPLIDDLVRVGKRYAPPRVLIDCGADVGTVSVLVAALDPGLARIIAFEPNRQAFDILRANIERLSIAGDARHAAVGAVAGRGALRSPAHDGSAHAMYVDAAADGDIDVVRLDDLAIDADVSVILKVDVEGGEFDVLKGGVDMLARAAAFAVSFEAQIDQFQRTGVEPMDIVRFLCAIRPCRYHVSDLPALELDIDRPFFTQVGAVQSFGYNILCYTDDRPDDAT